MREVVYLFAETISADEAKRASIEFNVKLKKYFEFIFDAPDVVSGISSFELLYEDLEIVGFGLLGYVRRIRH